MGKFLLLFFLTNSFHHEKRQKKLKKFINNLMIIHLNNFKVSLLLQPIYIYISDHLLTHTDLKCPEIPNFDKIMQSIIDNYQFNNMSRLYNVHYCFECLTNAITEQLYDEISIQCLKAINGILQYKELIRITASCKC